MKFSVKHFAIGAGLALLYLILSSMGIVLGVTPDRESQIVSQISNRGDYAFSASIFLALFHQFVPFPGHLLSIANSAVFGPGIGLTISMMGWFLSSQLGFALARVVGRPIERRFVKKSALASVDNAVDRQSSWMILTLRFTPFFSFSLLNFAFGFTSLKWWRFTWTTMIGVLPSTLVATGIGAGLVSLKKVEADVVIVALILVAAIIWAVRQQQQPTTP